MPGCLGSDPDSFSSSVKWGWLQLLPHGDAVRGGLQVHVKHLEHLSPWPSSTSSLLLISIKIHPSIHKSIHLSADLYNDYSISCDTQIHHALSYLCSFLCALPTDRRIPVPYKFLLFIQNWALRAIRVKLFSGPSGWIRWPSHTQPLSPALEASQKTSSQISFGLCLSPWPITSS